jgi:hypothetical protein
VLQQVTPTKSVQLRTTSWTHQLHKLWLEIPNTIDPFTVVTLDLLDVVGVKGGKILRKTSKLAETVGFPQYRIVTATSHKLTGRAYRNHTGVGFDGLIE